MKRNIARSAVALAALLVVPAAAGCSVGVAGVPSASPSAITAAPVLSDGRFPAVLSTTGTDTARTVTSAQMSGEIIRSDISKPAGFRTESTVVASGLGSFQIALPATYLPLWRAGNSPDPLLGPASSRDRGWADYARPRLSSARPDGTLRAMGVDVGKTDRVRSLIVTLSRAPAETGGALARRMGGELAREGLEVRETQAVTVNGAEGGYIEFGIPARQMNSSEPRVGLLVLILDPPNRMLWGVTCDAPESERADIIRTCAQIVSTFRPLPRVIG